MVEDHHNGNCSWQYVGIIEVAANQAAEYACAHCSSNMPTTPERSSILELAERQRGVEQVDGGHLSAEGRQRGVNARLVVAQRRSKTARFEALRHLRTAGMPSCTAGFLRSRWPSDTCASRLRLSQIVRDIRAELSSCHCILTGAPAKQMYAIMPVS